MAIFIDELTLTVPGNLVKKFDGTTTSIRTNREQLVALAAAVEEATKVFAGTQPSPPEEPKTAEAKPPAGANG